MGLRRVAVVTDRVVASQPFYESALRDSCDAINEAAISDSVLINKDPPEKKTEEGTRAQKKPRHIKNWDERLLKTRSPL